MEDDLLNQGGGGDGLATPQPDESGRAAVEPPPSEGTGGPFHEFEELREALGGPLAGPARSLTMSPTVDVPGVVGFAPPGLPHRVTGPIRAATTPTPSSGIPKILHGGSSQVVLKDYHPTNAPGVTVKVAAANLEKYPGIVDTACKLVGTIETCLRLLPTVAGPLTKKRTNMEILSPADLRADDWKKTIKNLARALGSDNANVLTTLFQKDLLKAGKGRTPLGDVRVIETMKQLAVSKSVNEAMQLAERIGVTGALQLAAATARVQTTLKEYSDGIQKILGELITPSSVGDINKTLKAVQKQLTLSYGERVATTTTSFSLPPTEERKKI